MEASYIKSVVYLVAYIFMYTQLFCWKKNDKQLNGIVWCGITFVLTMWINTMIAAIISLVNIPLRLIPMSICYIFIGIILRRFSKKNGAQEYTWNVSDMLVVVFLVLVAVGISLKIHGLNLQVSYLTSDPAVHFRYASEVIQGGSVKGYMFYAPVNNGLFVDLLSPFLSSVNYYKAFILADIIMFAVSGVIFYCVTRERMCSRKQQLVGFIMALIYMLGYPLNNKLYGFVYLGMSVTAIAVLIFILDLYIKNEISEKYATVLLMLGCHAIVMCYMLFAPVVYFAVLAVIVIKNGKKFFSKRVILQCFQIFLLPCCLAIYYCIFQFFIERNVDAARSLALNGASYGEVYSNFVFLLPLVIYQIIYWLKERKRSELLIFVIFFTVFMLGLLGLVFIDKTSWYYFYKVHHVLWLLYCWSALYGGLTLWERQKEMVVAYGSVIIALVFVWYFDINTAIVEKEIEKGYAALNESTTYFSAGLDIFSFNGMFLEKNNKYDTEKLDLYIYAAEELKANKNSIPMFVDIGGHTDYCWYESIIGREMKEFYVWNDTLFYANSYFEMQIVEYVIILYENPLYECYKNKIESFEKVYSNDVGCIIRIE